MEITKLLTDYGEKYWSNLAQASQLQSLHANVLGGWATMAIQRIKGNPEALYLLSKLSWSSGDRGGWWSEGWLGW